MKFNVGDRVRLYGWYTTQGNDGPWYSNGAIAEVLAVPLPEGGELTVQFQQGACEKAAAHPKQCRRLKKKVKVEKKEIAYLKTKISGFYDGTALGEVAAERDSLKARLKEADDAIKFAHDHCEAIALSSLLPTGNSYDDLGFFERQATKSVGSGGRAYHALKEYLQKYQGEKNETVV